MNGDDPLPAKNVQTLHLWDSNDDPTKFNSLAIYLTHSECGTAKRFTITENSRLLLNKDTKGLTFKTVCEECHSPLAVTIGWEE